METPEQYTVKTPEKSFEQELAEFGMEHFKKQYELLKKENSEALTAYNRECERNDELQKEIDRLKGTIGVECVKQLIAAREENKDLTDLLKDLYFEASTIASMGTGATVSMDQHSRLLFALAKAEKIVYKKFQPKKDENKN